MPFTLTCDWCGKPIEETTIAVQVQTPEYAENLYFDSLDHMKLKMNQIGEIL